eukprot:TRINITY_DN13975_c0_g1_i1.p1 TRINITY_DN13975_c0_g1~~TRINITY_DN13975_c0_g1_i1.p1  ORF type:complete len:122 (-),score=36.39 TRINITY_DN13975_c0_g1_i1:419-784(-)
MDLRVIVTIPKVQEAKEDGKPFTFYMMNVTVDGAHRDVTVVPRRYRDFEQLYSELAALFPQVFDPKKNPNPPSLPGKKWWGNMGAAVVEDRRQKLQNFLGECLEYKDIMMCEEIGRFLQIE